MLVNLGIGIPTLVANYLPEGMQVFFQSENGLIGTGAIPAEGMAHPMLTDAGGRPVTALPGASTFDSALSFGLIRGGHVDVTVLGGLQVDQAGRLANWMIPGRMVPGMGGAMDLVTGAKRVIVAMQHSAKGKSKIVRQCSLPLTSIRPVDLVVTELAVIAFPEGQATLVETGPGVSVGRRDRGDRSGTGRPRDDSRNAAVILRTLSPIDQTVTCSIGSLPSQFNRMSHEDLVSMQMYPISARSRNIGSMLGSAPCCSWMSCGSAATPTWSRAQGGSARSRLPGGVGARRAHAGTARSTTRWCASCRPLAPSSIPPRRRSSWWIRAPATGRASAA